MTWNKYIFSGWKSSDGGTAYTGGQIFTMPANDVTLTPRWTDVVILSTVKPTGSLFMVYVDSKSAVKGLDRSSYENGRGQAEIPTFPPAA